MDTGLHRIRKTVPRHIEKISAIQETSSIHIDENQYSLVEIRATGDLLLEVTFENRKSSLTLLSNNDSVPRIGIILKHAKSSNSRLLYRVRLDTLKKTSKYFNLLLGSDKFSEGKEIAAAFASLR